MGPIPSIPAIPRYGQRIHLKQHNLWHDYAHHEGNGARWLRPTRRNAEGLSDAAFSRIRMRGTRRDAFHAANALGPCHAKLKTSMARWGTLRSSTPALGSRPRPRPTTTHLRPWLSRLPGRILRAEPNSVSVRATPEDAMLAARGTCGGPQSSHPARRT